MPWNRWPKPGFLRALRERGYAYATPYRAQSLLAKAFGLRVYGGCQHSVWLHPPQLDDFSLDADPDLRFFFASELVAIVI